jgi:hypothetical protein
LALKLSLVKFLNTSVIYAAVHSSAENWFESGNLVNDVVTVLCFAAFAPLINLVVVFVTVLIQKCIICKQQCSDEKITQRQANKMSEAPPLDVENNISDFMNLVLSCLFYSPLLPFALPLCVIGCMFNYFATKFLLSNCHKMPLDFGSDLTIFFSDILPFTTVPLVVAYFIFAGGIYEASIELNEYRAKDTTFT